MNRMFTEITKKNIMFGVKLFQRRLYFLFVNIWFSYTNIPIIIVLGQRLYCSDIELEGKKKT